MMTTLLVLSLLILVTTFIASFSDRKQNLFSVAAMAVVMMFLGVSLMWSVVTESSRPVADLLPRVLASTFFTGSAAMWARLFAIQRRKRRQVS